MKQFIYMDNNYINSYISQCNDGLIIRSSEEFEDSTVKGEATTITTKDLDSNFKFKLPALFSSETSFNGEQEAETSNISKSKTAKELIEKIVHDNVFNNFLNLLKDNEGLIKENYKKGNYISIKDEFSIYDLDDFIDMFDERNLETIARSEFIEYDKITGKSRNQSEKIKYIKARKKELTESVLDILYLCKKVIPSSKFMIINDNFILLKDDSLRESISRIRFLYSSKVNIIGYYINDFDINNNQSDNSNFEEVFKSIDELTKDFLKSMFNLSDSIKIIIPIAIYFE